MVIAAILWVIGGRDARPQLRVLPTVLGLMAVGTGLLTLVAPTSLTSDVTLGIPFVPFAGTGRLVTPMGLITLVLLLATLAAASRSLLPLLLRVDLLGATFIAVALGSLVLTFASADPEREVMGPWGWALVPLGLLAVGASIWRHRTARDPLVPRGLMGPAATGGRSSLAPALAVSLLAGVALVAIVVDIPILARLTVTASQTTAALVLVRFLVAVPVGAFVGGWLLRWLGPAFVAASGLFLAGTGLVIMSGWGHGSLHSWSATPVLLVVGMGLGLAFAPVNAAALSSAPGDAHGVVSSLLALARMVGMVVGLAMLTAIGLRRYYAAVVALPNQQDTLALAVAGVVQVQTVFLGGAIAAFIAAGTSLALRGRPARR